MNIDALFSPLSIGNLSLTNRIVMAPLTRCRADSNHLPTPIMAKYYAQRAAAGLIIAEATMAIEGNSAFWREPGIYSEEHALAWKNVTDAIHKAGGIVALQLWHGGRACHSLLNNGAVPVAPSAIRIENDEVHTPQGKKPYEIPRELELAEIPAIIDGFKRAARFAKMAAFDAVEIHGANGYLLDEFLRDGTNKRQDEYGGTIENRARLLLEVVDATVEVYGKESVGVRISPINSYNDMLDSDPIALTKHVASALAAKQIAYLHVMRGDFFGKQQGDVLGTARKHFPGVIIANAGFTPQSAAEAIQNSSADAIAFGHHFVSNPDLVQRIRLNVPLAEPDASTFYTQDEKGYTDYPMAT